MEHTQLITPDFSQTVDPVGAGIYKARITGSKVDAWPGKDGNPPIRFVAWTLETFAETEEKNNGRKIFHRTAIEGAGAFRLQDFYRAATGVDCSGAFDPSTLHGCELEVTIAPQKSNPQYTEVKSVKPLSH
jgi:hypothetical protein